MESFTAIGTQLRTQFEGFKKAQSCVNTTCVTQSCDTSSALSRETQSCDNTTCTVYEMIPKREYGLLLRQLEEWGVAYPKAVCRKWGVLTVKIAVEYTKATPNVRNRGAYFTFMCRQLKSEKQNPPSTMSVVESKEEKGINPPKNDLTAIKPLKTIPQINDYRAALAFVCDFNDGFFGNDEKIVEFARQIKKKYNFA